ncbi:MAG TPA: AraC family transcriptional regulator [Caulobacteraceae bacterium]|jgi:AraC-like DNA-binding protein|nr:AraC family transcriptional regulator [Caulobacteraceae bacterium]
MGPSGAHATLELDGAGATEAWRRALDDDPDRLFATIGPEAGFSGRYAADPVGDGLVIDVRAHPLHLRDERPAENAAPVVMLQAVVEGRPAYQSRSGEIQILRSGQVVIRRQDPAVQIRSERFAHITTVAVPQHLLVPRHVDAASLAACRDPLEDALPSRLLYDLIVGLGKAGGAARAPGFLDVLGGLVALVAAQRPQPAVPLSDLAAARASGVIGYLRRNFSNPQLDPQTLADDLSISVRYAHKLMRMTGRSFREALIGLRLDAARMAFAANRRPRQTIADIAISVGFNDLSQFNRHFRDAFGMTPRAARRLDEIYGFEAGASLARGMLDLSEDDPAGSRPARNDRVGPGARAVVAGAPRLEPERATWAETQTGLASRF